MVCSPAKRSRATNGVVFHVSAHTMLIQVMEGSPKNDTVGSPTRASRRLMGPKGSLKIQRQPKAITVVGRAQGNRLTVRTSVRPLKG